MAIAQGFGIQSYDIDGESDPTAVLTQALEQRGPCLINIPINHSHNVLPMVPPGAANSEMIGA